MAIDNESLVNRVKEICPEAETIEFRGQLTIKITRDKLLEVANELKGNAKFQFNQLVDVSAIDWMKRQNRFEVVYFLYSIPNKSRVRLKVEVDEKKCECPSITSVWESANWYERETFDMYGVKFTGHPGLRRFYMPEDFNDPETGAPLYPLRKDFPLMGVPDSTPLPPYPEKYGDLID